MKINSNQLCKFLYLFLISLGFIISPVVFFSTHMLEGYEYFFLQPLFFSILFFSVYILFRKKINFFDVYILIVLFSRYVVLPFLTGINQCFGGRSRVSPVSSSFNLANALMLFELFSIVFMLIFYSINKKRKIKLRFNRISETLNKPFLFTVLITILLITIKADLLKQINFLNNVNLHHDNNSTLINFMLIFISTMKEFILVYLMYYFSQKEKDTVVLILYFLNISIYTGSSRISVVLTFLASTYILFQLIEIRPGIMVLAIITLIMTFNNLTQARNYTQISTNYWIELQNKLQAYLGGIYNVAIAVETRYWYRHQVSFFNLFYDFFRSFFGTNIIFKNMDMLYTNQYFNFRMWTHVDRRSQILPMIGQGYFYFGFLFSTVLSSMSMKLLLVFKDKISSEVSKERPIQTYIYILFFLRSSIFPGQNIMNLTGYMSTYFVLYIVMILINHVFKEVFS